MSRDDQEAWREQRRAAAEEHVAALERRRAAESAQARQLIAGFVRDARDRGLEPTQLRASGRSGHRKRFRTGLVGWYLKRDGSLAVDTAGEFYHMSTDADLRTWLRGAALAPSDPPLAVGVGARDGESMTLVELLELRLEAGEDFPTT